MLRSLRSQLSAVWLLCLVAALAAAWLVFAVHGQAVARAIAGGGFFTGPLLAVILLAATLLGSLIWVTARLASFSRQTAEVEQILTGAGGHRAVGRRTAGCLELDRLVAAADGARVRLDETLQRKAAENDAAAEAERIATLGRAMAAIADVLEDPVVTIRLNAGHALAEADRIHAVVRLESLASDLRLLTERPVPEIRDVALAPFLTECIGFQRDIAGNAGIILSARAATPTARFDPARIGRALDNLVANALAHTPRGGAVRVDARAVADRLSITVGDTGPGVDPALRPHLFEPFVSGRPNGTGLGLAVVKEIADSHGGTIRLHDTPSGAIFALELPRPEA